MQERLQKILSARGICSRRKAEQYIEQGLVKVNGEVAKIGQKADPEKDRIQVSGKVLEARAEMLYYVVNKPVGVLTQEAVPAKLNNRVYPVGRLDKNTSGLLLLTNDGPLAYRLTHPKFFHEKEYEVEVHESITDGQLSKLKKGITISGVKTKPARVTRINRSKFFLNLTEGRNRQIRRMCQKVGSPVINLKRIRIVTLKDEKLKPGQVRELSENEKKSLLSAVGL